MISKILREPLLHFVGLGGLVFALFVGLDDTPPAPAPDRIEVDATLVERITAAFEATWRRQPSDSELERLIDGHVEEEILVREAKLLGLDRDDEVIRQRLALKMRFLLEAGAAAETPDDATLAAFMAERPERFRTPPMVSFEQIPLARGGLSLEATLSALRDGADPESLGASTLLPGEIRRMPPLAVDSVFGTGFFAQIETLGIGAWNGPVTSGYGAHLVRVTELEPAVLPPLETIRDAVLLEWRSAAAEALAAERIAALRARYDIRRVDTSGDKAE